LAVVYSKLFNVLKEPIFYMKEKSIPDTVNLSIVYMCYAVSYICISS
jgi:hypothetical protein